MNVTATSRGDRRFARFARAERKDAQDLEFAVRFPLPLTNPTEIEHAGGLTTALQRKFRLGQGSKSRKGRTGGQRLPGGRRERDEDERARHEPPFEPVPPDGVLDSRDDIAGLIVSFDEAIRFGRGDGEREDRHGSKRCAKAVNLTSGTMVVAEAPTSLRSRFAQSPRRMTAVAGILHLLQHRKAG